MPPKRGGGSRLQAPGSKRGAAPAARTPGRRAAPSGLRASDYDEVDLHHLAKGKLSLRLDEEEEERGRGDESDSGEGVFDLGLDEEEEGEDEDEEEEEDDRLMAEMRRAKKVMKDKLQREAAEDEDEPEEEEEAAGWGKRKQSYYDDRDYEKESDSEAAAAEEEKEALRLQREAAGALRAQDFGQDEWDEQAEAEEGEAAGAARPLAGAPALARQRGAVVEALRPSAAAPGDARAAAQQQAPELLALCNELRGALREVRSRAAPLLAAAQAAQAAPEGLSYLAAKQLLLLTYCLNITFYVMMKAEGRPVADHPVMARLLEARTFLERARPIDRRMAYQINKLLRIAGDAAAGAAAGAGGGAEEAAEAAEAAGDEEDPMQLRPNLGAFGGAAPAAAAGGAGLYRAPRLAPARMAGEEAGSGREARAAAERRRRASRSALVQQLTEELTGAPREVREAATAGGMDGDGFVAREEARLARRAAEEETMFVRVPLSRTERKRAEAAERKLGGMAAQVGDFADDVGDVVQAVEALERGGGGGGGGGLAPPPAAKRVKLSSIAAAAEVQARGQAELRRRPTGEQDVPRRPELGERRAAHERRPAPGARRAAAAEEEEEGGGGGGGGELEEDEFYQQAASAAAAKRASKQDKYDPGRLYPRVHAPAAPAVGDDGSRPISGAMASNRGLTPHRNKEMKNPRKKHRIQYERALVRRKGAVREATAGAAGAAYGGEVTGIKSKVVKSRKL